MPSVPVFIPAEHLKRFATEVLIHAGMERADAEISADVLVTADLRGIESHGISRLRMYYDGLKSGRHNPQIDFEIVSDQDGAVVVDAHGGMGHPVGVRAMQLAIEKARIYGLGAVAVRNSSHFGIAGYYTLLAVRAGMIGLSFTNARPSVAPTFGVRPALGTNPIAFGAPTDEECPFLFDAATSIIQRGKIEVMAREGKPMPPGYVISREGELLTDARRADAGFASGLNALLPLGGSGEELG
jgi:LDH2 family malate/lactate/ureidoglycolate dehydrogenase